MSGLEKATIDGFNEYVDKLRSETNTDLTLVLFDHEYLIPVDNKPIKDVPKLNNELYQPRGSTALVDAVCRTLKERKGSVGKKDKALVLIITDGMENASREFKTADMQKLVQELEKQGNWTFTYLGANQDAWDVAKQWGFQQGNVSSYVSSDMGTAVAFASMSANTARFARSATMNVKSFYQEDKEKLENAK